MRKEERVSKKRDEEPDGPPEVASFNEELVSFDLDDVSVEELERRFELAVAPIIAGGLITENGACGTLFCGNVGCAGFSCGTMGPPPV